jgi:cytidylate kinase
VTEPRVIAIDGPAGSGKSTVARELARRLGLDYLDTGAMYRSVAFAALQRGVDPEDKEPVARLAHQIAIDVGDKVLVDGYDASIEIRGPEVTRAVSTVAANPEVRTELRDRQRAWAQSHRRAVVEGRDIGTVVFPDAELKVFLTAADDERARRRHKEVTALNYNADSPGLAVEAVQADLARRDHLDSSRATSPLAIADDAVVIDTTGRSVDDIVGEVMGLLPPSLVGLDAAKTPDTDAIAEDTPDTDAPLAATPDPHVPVAEAPDAETDSTPESLAVASDFDSTPVAEADDVPPPANGHSGGMVRDRRGVWRPAARGRVAGAFDRGLYRVCRRAIELFGRV